MNQFPKKRSGEMLFAASLCFASLLVAWRSSAQMSDAPAEDGKQEVEAKFRAYAQAVAGEYELRSADDASDKFTRVTEPILRWSNPLGGHQAHGEIFLWTDRGLPVAVLSINEFTRVTGKVDGEHEWCSLRNGPRSEERRVGKEGRSLWSAY